MKFLGLVLFLVLVEGRPQKGHEQFWSDPKFFASLTDYLTAPNQQKGVASRSQQVIVSQFASIIPKDSQDSGSEQVPYYAERPVEGGWRDYAYRDLRPRPQRFPALLIATPESFAAKEVLEFHVPHPNSLPLQGGKSRRRPLVPRRRRKKLKSTTTPTPTTTTTTKAPTTPTLSSTTTKEEEEYYDDDEYPYEEEEMLPQKALLSSHFSQTHPHPSSTYYSKPEPFQFLQQLSSDNSFASSVSLPQNVLIAAPSQSPSLSYDQVIAASTLSEPQEHNDVDGQTPGLASRLSDIIETTRKILYFPKGVVDVVDQAMTYAEANPYVNLALGTVADTLFGTTHLSGAKGLIPSYIKNLPRPLIAKPKA